MAKTLYLHQPKDSSNFSFRRAIPKDLVEHFGKKVIKFSLNTSDRKKAEELARIKAVETDQQFEEARRQMAPQIVELSDTEIERLALLISHTMLEADDSMRMDGSFADQTMFDRFKAEGDQRLSEARAALGRGDLSPVEDVVSDLLQHHGYEMDKGTEEYRKLGMAVLRAYVDASDKQQQRRQGIVIPTPAVPAETQKAESKPDRPKAELMTIEEAVEKYIDFKTNGPKPWASSSQKDIPPQVRQFAEIVGKDKLIGDLNRDDMRLYWDSMMKLPSRRMTKPYRDKTLKQLLRMNIPEGERLSPKTLDTRFTNIKTFMNWAEDEGCFDKARPLNKVLIAPDPEPTAPKRTTFDQSDLEQIFHPDRYGKGKLFTKPWHYWMPLLALFTGARAEELAQLYTSDIKQIGGVWVIDINEIGDKRVKTKAGRRRVPLHPFIISLDFLEFVEWAKRQKGEQLFKELKIRKSSGNRSGAVSQWFTRYRRTCGVGAMDGVSSLTFHSFRHTVITWCKHHDINRDKYKEVVGHERGEVRDVTSGYEAAQLTEKLLHEVIEPIDFHSTIPLDHLKEINWMMW